MQYSLGSQLINSTLNRAAPAINQMLGFFGIEARKKRTGLETTADILKKQNIEIVLDVGANKGQFTQKILQHGYCGIAISFEPGAEAHKKLSANAADHPRWIVHPRSAVGSKNAQETVLFVSNNDGVSSSVLEMQQLHITNFPESSTAYKETCPMICLDSIIDTYDLLSKNTFLKIDTQGYEKSVLEGAKNLLPHVAGVMLECSTRSLYKNDSLYGYFFELFTAEGFELFDLHPGRCDQTTGQLLWFDATFIRTN